MELQPAASTPSAANRVLTLSTTAFTLFAVWLMLGVLGVPIQAELRLTPVQFAWLAAIAILSGSIFRLPVAMLADRWGGRVVTTALLLITAVPCFAIAHVDSYGGLLACAFLYGLAGNSSFPGAGASSRWFMPPS